MENESEILYGGRVRVDRLEKGYMVRFSKGYFIDTQFFEREEEKNKFIETLDPDFLGEPLPSEQIFKANSSK